MEKTMVMLNRCSHQRGSGVFSLLEILVPHVPGRADLVAGAVRNTLGPVQQPPAGQDAGDRDDDDEPVPE
jgi:hypothetical protein